MRRVALTLRADAVEEVLDVLMPLLPQGVYERELDAERDGGRVLRRRDARRRRSSTRSPATRCSAATRRRCRTRARSAGAAPGGRGRWPGGCGSARPTTRRPRTARSRSSSSRRRGRSGPARTRPRAGASSCCSSSSRAAGSRTSAAARACVAIAGARLGWEPVYGLDFDERVGRRDASATRERNGVAVRAVLADLREIPAPPAHTLVANIPLDVHERVAGSLSPATGAGDRRRGSRPRRRRPPPRRYGRAGLVAAGPPGRGRAGPRCGWSGA